MLRCCCCYDCVDLLFGVDCCYVTLFTHVIYVTGGVGGVLHTFCRYILPLHTTLRYALFTLYVPRTGAAVYTTRLLRLRLTLRYVTLLPLLRCVTLVLRLRLRYELRSLLRYALFELVNLFVAIALLRVCCCRIRYVVALDAIYLLLLLPLLRLRCVVPVALHVAFITFTLLLLLLPLLRCYVTDYVGVRLRLPFPFTTTYVERCSVVLRYVLRCYVTLRLRCYVVPFVLPLFWWVRVRCSLIHIYRCCCSCWIRCVTLRSVAVTLRCSVTARWTDFAVARLRTLLRFQLYPFAVTVTVADYRDVVRRFAVVAVTRLPLLGPHYSWFITFCAFTRTFTRCRGVRWLLPPLLLFGYALLLRLPLRYVTTTYVPLCYLLLFGVVLRCYVDCCSLDVVRCSILGVVVVVGVDVTVVYLLPLLLPCSVIIVPLLLVFCCYDCSCCDCSVTLLFVTLILLLGDCCCYDYVVDCCCCCSLLLLHLIVVPLLLRSCLLFAFVLLLFVAFIVVVTRVVIHTLLLFVTCYHVALPLRLFPRRLPLLRFDCCVVALLELRCYVTTLLLRFPVVTLHCVVTLRCCCCLLLLIWLLLRLVSFAFLRLFPFVDSALRLDLLVTGLRCCRCGYYARILQILYGLRYVVDFVTVVYR